MLSICLMTLEIHPIEICSIIVNDAHKEFRQESKKLILDLSKSCLGAPILLSVRAGWGPINKTEVGLQLLNATTSKKNKMFFIKARNLLLSVALRAKIIIRLQGTPDWKFLGIFFTTLGFLTCT